MIGRIAIFGTGAGTSLGEGHGIESGLSLRGFLFPQSCVYACFMRLTKTGALQKLFTTQLKLVPVYHIVQSLHTQ